MRFALVLAVLALAAPGLAGAAGGFTPATLAGAWTGTWKNLRFGSTGPASITAKALAGGTKLVFSADFGGNVFGCTDPNPESSKPLTKGAGPGHWNDGGFVIAGASKAFGQIKLVYTHAKRTLTGSGSNPTCAAGLSWALAGKFAGATFTGKVSIKLPDGTTAVSDLSLKRR